MPVAGAVIRRPGSGLPHQNPLPSDWNRMSAGMWGNTPGPPTVRSMPPLTVMIASRRISASSRCLG